MNSTSEGNFPILTKFRLEERGEQVEVQPVWLLVHQEHSGGPARYTAALPCPALPLSLPCPAPPRPTPPRLAPPWPALPCPALPCPAQCSAMLLPFIATRFTIAAELCCYRVPMPQEFVCLTGLNDSF